MTEQLSVFKLMQKTYPFIILRFLVILLTIVPIAWITLYFAEFFFRLFNLNVDGIVYKIFWLNFAVIGCSVGTGLLGFVRKTILFYIKAAHVIAIAKLCTNDTESGLILSSINEVRKRFISVNIFYIADGLLMAGIRDVSETLLRQDILPALNPSNAANSLPGKLKNMGLKLFGQVIKTTLGYCDEIVLSYVYVCTRADELYGPAAQRTTKRPGRKLTKEGKKKTTIKAMFKYAVDGICLYTKNCLSLVKSAIILVLQINIFGWIVSIISCIVIFTILGSEIIRTATVFILMRIIYNLFSYTLIEPYETAVLVSEFYNVLYETEGDLQLDKIRDKLVGFSKPFKKMVTKSLGKEEAAGEEQENGAAATGSVIDDDILEAAGKAFGEAFREEDLKAGSEDNFDKNMDDIEKDQ